MDAVYRRRETALRGTHTSLSLSGSLLVGHPVTFTASVTSLFGAIPDGDSVGFENDGRRLGVATTLGGVARLTVPSLQAGRHRLRATYFGDPIFKVSSLILRGVVVAKYSTTTTLVSSLNPAIFGQPVTYTVTVTSTGPDIPTGN